MPKRGRFQDFPLGPRPAGTPIHRWLFAELGRAILDGRLKPGARLPSTRSLARQEAIARVTVVSVFGQLQAEGYVTSRIGSGTVVAAELPDRFFASSLPPARPRLAPSRASPSARGAAIAARRPSVSAPTRAFGICAPGNDCFPLRLWTQLTARRLRLSGGSLLEPGDPRGYRPLREAVADYLNTRRSVHCDAEQIVIVSGAQQAFDFIARITLDPGDPVWMENPGYPGAVRAFAAAGAKVVPVPVDDAGLMIGAGVRRERAPKLVYVTPAHQFPLGVMLSLERRLALLALAQRQGFWILEDDYDGEYRYDVRPIGALQGHDRGGHVIYTGSFNKMMFPALRLGYVVLPHRLARPFLSLRDAVDRFLPTLEQAVLADFIREDYFERHVRRSKAVYQERRDVLLDASARHLAGLLDLQKTDAGFQALGWLPGTMPDVQAQARAAEFDVDVTPLSGFYLDGAVKNALLLGFASVPAPAICTGVERLARALGRRR